RRGLPAVALTADTAVLTSWANDRSYESVFARQIQALGTPGDALVVLSTSGRSANVTAALVEARRRGMQSVALLGGDGGDAAALASVAITVPSTDTQRIQELHLLLIHTLAALVERRITESDGATHVAAPARAQSHGRRTKAVDVR